MPLLESIGSASSRGTGMFGDTSFPFDISGIRTSNLQLALGPGGSSYKPSQPNDWLDISGNNNHFKIVPASYKIDSNTQTPYFDFRGSHGMAKTASGIDVPGWTDTTPATMISFTRMLTPTPVNWRTIARTTENGGLTTGTATRHHVIIQNNGNMMGMYNNNNALTGSSSVGFLETGYSVTSIPGYGTSTWAMYIYRYQDANGLYYNFSYNDTPGTIRASINNRAALFMKGPMSVGGYHGGGVAPDLTNPAIGDQFWGDISSFFLWNARLSDQECLDVFNKYKGFYGL
jgi:hypothetical protein